jgi:hypothetical protein
MLERSRCTMQVCTTAAGDLELEGTFQYGLGHLREQPIRAVDRNTGRFGVGQQCIHLRRRLQLRNLCSSTLSRRIRL